MDEKENFSAGVVTELSHKGFNKIDLSSIQKMTYEQSKLLGHKINNDPKENADPPWEHSR